jgi:hypothetical protein
VYALFFFARQRSSILMKQLGVSKLHMAILLLLLLLLLVVVVVLLW